MPALTTSERTPVDIEHDDWPREKGWSFHDLWRNVSDWFARFFRGINNETIEHPYFIAFALIVVWAWPHIIMLPVWFSKDAARRMEDHARTVTSRITAPARRRKRDVFIARYRSIVNASYEPSSRPAQFGGTPLHEGHFTVEEERSLPIALRVIRWSALIWAVFILGREWYRILSN